MIGQNVCFNDNVTEIISYFHQNAPSYLEFCVYINTNIMLNMFFFFFFVALHTSNFHFSQFITMLTANMWI